MINPLKTSDYRLLGTIVEYHRQHGPVPMRDLRGRDDRAITRLTQHDFVRLSGEPDEPVVTPTTDGLMQWLTWKEQQDSQLSGPGG